MVFQDWEPEAQYHTDTHDIAAEFYRPCMRDAIRYDRITGYFSSAIYLIVWTEIVDFARRDGRIRIICSPSFSAEDAQTMSDAYRARTDEELAVSLLADYHRLLETPHLSEHAKALAGLIVDGVVDIRIAQLSPDAKASSRAMFHDKTGLFFDDNGDVIGFRGGMNETYLGLAVGGNVDSIDAWTSWAGGREADRVETAINRFASLWADGTPGIDVREVPDVALDEFSRIAAAEEPWQIKAEAIAAASHVEAMRRPEPGFTLFAHQEKALAAWEDAGRRGLLKHATGAGKTFTSTEAIRRELLSGHRPVVLVPSAFLLYQWTTELKQHLADIDIRVHPCGDGHSDWTDLLAAWLSPTDTNRIVVSTIATAVSDRFLGQLRRAASRLMIVADEAHRLGAPKAQALFDVPAATRLGLSATPERAGDPDGTAALFSYFGGIVDTFGLQDAIEAGVSTPYDYEPHVVNLNESEQDQWEALSQQISQRVAELSSSNDTTAAALNHPTVKRLLIQRARIIKKAEAKTSLARSVLTDNYRTGDRWLVYCEDQDQLRDVVAGLLDASLPVTEYHSAMAGDRSATMRNFATNGGVLVSIKCLDEGVDIPVATHALILASSRNPREFIQRRGRVLRRAPDKAFAQIFDALVVPTPPLEPSGRTMILGELARAAEFANNAFTHRARGELTQAFINAGGDLSSPDLTGGFEPDEDD